MTFSPWRTITLVLAAPVIYGSGIWLTRAGRPYGLALLGLHKLTGVAAVVLIGLRIHQAHRASPLSVGDWAVVAVASAVAVVTFATGGALSAMAAAPTWVLGLHGLAGWVAGINAIAVLYWVGRG